MPGGSVYFDAVPLAIVAALQYPQSTLAPKSDFSGALDGLFTNIFWWALFVFIVVEVLLLVAIVRYRARPGGATPKEIHGHTALEIGWTLAPALILVFIAVPTIRTVFDTAGHAPEGALRVEVVGHQWWWEYRYPTLGITVVNELHIPVRTPVQLEMTSADVIHSFWAPQLFGKRDVIQGRINRIAFTADALGEYLGQCAEFCGISHANMRLRVFVQSDSAFQAWVSGQRTEPKPPPIGSALERGRQEFVGHACFGCHTIAGVSKGTIGPDLTHIGSRTTIAAGLLPNTPESLRRWIENAPAVKPGALMPPQNAPGIDLDAIVAYLQSLK